jgi:hypothetical protein
MTTYKFARAIVDALKQLSSFTIQNLGNNQYRIKGAETSRYAAQVLMSVPGLQGLANGFLANQIFINRVQNEINYQDDGSNIASLIKVHKELVDAAMAVYAFAASFNSRLEEVVATSATSTSDFEIRFSGDLNLEEFSERLQQTNTAIQEILYVAEQGGIIEHRASPEVLTVGPGSIYVALAGSASVVSFLLIVARKALALRAEYLRQKEAERRLELTGLGAETIKQQIEIHKMQAALYCQQLAMQVQVEKPLDPENLRRLEHAIRSMSNNIANGVRILGSPSSTQENEVMSNEDYDQIENASKEFPLLEAGAAATKKEDV